MTTAYIEEPTGYTARPDVNALLNSHASIEQRCADLIDSFEEEFARLLDFYHFSWQHKPRTFAVEWDDEGNFVGSFTPAFYLTDHNQYVEVLAPGRGPVAEKNRLVRLLRQNYPEIRIKLLSWPDCHKMIARFAANNQWQ